MIDDGQTHPDSELVSGFLDGELTPAERARVVHRLAEDSELRRLHDDLVAMRAQFRALTTLTPSPALYEYVMKQIEAGDCESLGSTISPSTSSRVSLMEHSADVKPRGYFRWGALVGAVAALMLLFASPLTLWLGIQQNVPREVARNDAADSSVEQALRESAKMSIEPSRDIAQHALDEKMVEAFSALDGPAARSHAGEMRPPVDSAADSPDTNSLTLAADMPTEMSETRGQESLAPQPDSDAISAMRARGFSLPSAVQDLPSARTEPAESNAIVTGLRMPTQPLMFLRIDPAVEDGKAAEFTAYLREQQFVLYVGQRVEVPGGQVQKSQLQQLLEALGLDPATAPCLVYVEASVADIQAITHKYPDAQLAIPQTLPGGFDVERLLKGTLVETQMAETYSASNAAPRDDRAETLEQPGASANVAYVLTGAIGKRIGSDASNATSRATTRGGNATTAPDVPRGQDANADSKDNGEIVEGRDDDNAAAPLSAAEERILAVQRLRVRVLFVLADDVADDVADETP